MWSIQERFSVIHHPVGELHVWWHPGLAIWVKMTVLGKVRCTCRSDWSTNKLNHRVWFKADEWHLQHISTVKPLITLLRNLWWKELTGQKFFLPQACIWLWWTVDNHHHHHHNNNNNIPQKKHIDHIAKICKGMYHKKKLPKNMYTLYTIDLLNWMFYMFYQTKFRRKVLDTNGYKQLRLSSVSDFRATNLRTLGLALASDWRLVTVLWMLSCRYFCLAGLP